MQRLNEAEVLEALYNGVSFNKIYAPDVCNEYNQIASKLDLELMTVNPIFSEEWFFPKEYKTLDLIDYFAKKVNTEEEELRVAEELNLFLESNNENLLRYLIYLGDVIKDNDVIVGVGRGSSVSLFTLYLAGIHKVNSLKFNLSPNEFFKRK